MGLSLRLPNIPFSRLSPGFSRVLFILFAGLLFEPSAAIAKQSICHQVAPKHTALGELLGQYVRNGQVDYAKWHKNIEARQTLKKYLRSIGDFCESSFKRRKPAEQLAMLLNLYNAAVIELVLQHYPLQSIRSIKVDGQGAFDLKWIQTQWSDLKIISLNQLENEIIRPRFKDARIHFALVCAAMSCPPLLPLPYDARRVFEQLARQTRKVFQDKRQVFYDKGQSTLKVSKIFKWYEVDFVADAGSLAAYLRRELKNAGGPSASVPFQIEFNDYSWALNQAP